MGCGPSRDIEQNGEKEKIGHFRTTSGKASLSTMSQERVIPGKKNNEFRRLAIPLDVHLTDFSKEGEDFDLEHLEASQELADTAEAELIESALSKHFLFQDLPSEAIKRVHNVMTKVNVSAKDVVIEEGDANCKFFYIVSTGTLQVQIGKEAMMRRKKLSIQMGKLYDTTEYTRGHSFGELALLYNSARNASIIAKTDSSLWRLERGVFRKLLLKYSTESKKMNFLRNVPLFRDLSDHTLTNWGKTLNVRSYSPGEKLFSKGDEACFCVVYDGEVLYKRPNSESQVRLHATHFFGDREILFNSSFELDYFACEEKGATVIELKKDEFMKILKYIDAALDDNIKFTALKNIPLLEHLTEEQVIEVVDAFVQENYEMGDTIIKKGDLGHKVYIIKRGQVIIKVDNPPMELFCKPYDYVGERALLYEEPRAATVEAISPEVCVLSLKREDFEQLLGPLSSITKQRNALNILKEVDFLKNSSEEELLTLAEVMTISRYEEGSYIVRQGEVGDTFYVMKEGRAVVTRNDDVNKVLAQYERGGFFGERALLDDEPRAANIKAYGGPVICFEITREVFHRHFSEMTNIIRLQARSLRQHEEEKKMTLKSMKEIAVVGHGTYGRVKMMQCKLTARVYALKSLIKENIKNAGIQYQVRIIQRFWLNKF